MSSGVSLPFSKYMLQTSVAMVNPAGTGSPARHISANPAPLPPSVSFILPSPSVAVAPNDYTYFFILFSLPMNWLRFPKNPRSSNIPSRSHGVTPNGFAESLDPAHSPEPCQRISLPEDGSKRSSVEH